MNPFKCLPFFHPTRIAFIDDERSFLSILLNRLKIGLPVVTYDSPRAFLADLKQKRVSVELDTDWWTCYADVVGDPAQNQIVVLDKAMIFQHLYDENRFETLSVIVVDYDMPEMSGLTLCRELADLPCKKILLTGHADSNTVVHAFNEGLIDLYLPKFHPRLELELKTAVRRFQLQYMTAATELVAQVLRAEDPAIWSDASFCALFQRICADRGAVEYYAVDDPKGFLLLDRFAHARLLLLYSGAEIDAQCAAAKASRAPAGVVAELQARRGALHFQDDGGDQVLTERQWWDACIPTYAFPGNTGRFYSVVDRPEPFPVTPDTVLGLGRYLSMSR